MGSKEFVRKEKGKKTRITGSWRKPKGHQNKQRLQHKAHKPKVKPGFGTKTEDKHKNKDGLKIVPVKNLEEIKNIKPKTETALIQRVGMKTKLVLIEEAEKLNIKIHNLNIKKYKAKADEALKKKREAAKERDKKQAEKAKKAKTEEDKKKAEKKEEKKEEETPQTEEDKKKAEKEIKDKILTKAK